MRVGTPNSVSNRLNQQIASPPEPFMSPQAMTFEKEAGLSQTHFWGTSYSNFSTNADRKMRTQQNFFVSSGDIQGGGGALTSKYSRYKNRAPVHPPFNYDKA